MQKESLERQVLSKVIFNLGRVRETSSDARNGKCIKSLSFHFIHKQMTTCPPTKKKKLGNRPNDHTCDIKRT
jgi:hypothetical protein